MAQVPKHIFTCPEYIPGKNPQDIKKNLQSADLPIIKLASNESPYPPPVEILEKLKEALTSLHLYPDPQALSLKQALSEVYSLPKEYFLCSDGSDSLLQDFIRCFIRGPECKAIGFHNTFPAFRVQSLVQEGTVLFLPQKENYHPDISSALHFFSSLSQEEKKSCKVFYLANPNNPTGDYLTQKEILTIFSHVPKSCLILLDEAYEEFSRFFSDFSSGISLLNQFPNIVLLRTFSKAFSIAGLRLGYAIGHPSLLTLVQKFKMPFSVNSLALIAGTEFFKKKNLLLQQKLLKQIQEQKEELELFFHSLKWAFLKSAGNFVCFRPHFSTHFPTEQLHFFLESQGLIIRLLPLTIPPEHKETEYWLRVTIGTAPQMKAFQNSCRQFFLKQESS